MGKLRLILGIGAMCLCAAAQGPTFEVASVKLAGPAGPPSGMGMICLIPCTPGERMSIEESRVDIRYMPLDKLIVAAWRIKPYQLSGPDWMRTQRFDIAAKIADGDSRNQLPEMLQALLAERFKLAIHRQPKDQPVMALIVGKNGSKLQPAAADADTPPAASPADKPMYSGQGDARILANGDIVVTGGDLGPIRLQMIPEGLRFDLPKITMAGLADLITPRLDHPVVDMTNLPGSYAFYYQVSFQPGGGAESARKAGGSAGELDNAPRTDPTLDAMFAALDRSGLKLEARHAPVDTIFVDHLEKTPTAN